MIQVFPDRTWYLGVTEATCIPFRTMVVTAEVDILVVTADVGSLNFTTGFGNLIGTAPVGTWILGALLAKLS